MDGSFKSLTLNIACGHVTHPTPSSSFATMPLSGINPAIAVFLEICESDAVCSPDEEEEEGPSESDHWRGPAPTVEEKSR